MCWFLRQWPGLGLGQKCGVILGTRAVKTSAVRMSDVRILKLGNGAGKTVMLQTLPPAQTFSTPRPGDLFVMTILIYSHKSIDDTFGPRMGNLFPHSWTLLDGKDSPHHYWPLHQVLLWFYTVHRASDLTPTASTIQYYNNMVSRCPRPPASCWGHDYNGELLMSSGHNNHNTTTSNNNTAQDQQQTWHLTRAVGRVATGVLLDHYCICRWWSHIAQPKDNGRKSNSFSNRDNLTDLAQWAVL